MPEILVRAHKRPWKVADAEETLRRNLIGNNTGNLVFSQAVYRLLARSDVTLQTSGLAKLPPEAINERYERVVIPLANAFRPAYVETLEALSEVIERLTVPVTVLGVGAQASLTGDHPDDERVRPVVRRFVRAVLDRSPSIGVRGEFTRSYLRGLGFGDAQVDVIGCPSMFMYGPDLPELRLAPGLTRESRIALNISPYVSEMGPISHHNAERYPNLVYMAQNIQTLELMLYGRYPMGRKSAMRTSGVPVSLEHPLIRQNRVRFFLDPTTWMAHLAGYAFSFGTRIHGNIAALLAGTPALVLSHDSRTLELADYHAIPHRMVSSVGPQADAAALYAETDWSGLHAGHGERWDHFAGFLADQGLRHVYADGQDPAGFDRRLADTAFPPPVETMMGLSPEQLYEVSRELREARAELRHLRKQQRPVADSRSTAARVAIPRSFRGPLQRVRRMVRRARRARRRSGPTRSD